MLKTFLVTVGAKKLWQFNSSYSIAQWKHSNRSITHRNCNKCKFYNPYIFAIWWCKPLIVQTRTVRLNRIHSLKYQMSTTSGFKDIGISKSEFVERTQFLYFTSKLYLEILVKLFALKPHQIQIKFAQMSSHSTQFYGF